MLDSGAERQFPAALLLLLSLCACATRPDAAADPLADTTWVLDSLWVEGARWEAISQSVVTATFSNGELAGDMGCNRYSRPYAAAGREVQWGALLLTGAACDSPAIIEQEDAFIVALEAVAEFSLSPTSLELLDSDGRPVILFSEPDSDL